MERDLSFYCSCGALLLHIATRRNVDCSYIHVYIWVFMKRDLHIYVWVFMKRDLTYIHVNIHEKRRRLFVYTYTFIPMNIHEKRPFCLLQLLRFTLAHSNKTKRRLFVYSCIHMNIHEKRPAIYIWLFMKRD